MAVTSSDNRVAGRLTLNGADILYQSQVTMVGLEKFASYLAAPFSSPLPFMPFVSVGQGETAPSTEDITIETEKYRKLGSASVIGKAYVVSAIFDTWEPGDAYILREVGLLNELHGGDLFVRFLLDEDIDIAAVDILEIIIYIYPERF
jgi:hypothetical protein